MVLATADQLMIKAESTYKTRVTVDRAYEFIKFSFKPDLSIVDVPAIRASGQFQRTDRTKRVVKGYTGSIELPVTYSSMGLWLQHALGDDTITTITGTARRHTITPSAGQVGKYMTIQGSIVDAGGTQNVFTYGGGKITEWELSCEVDGFLKLMLGVDAANGVTNTSLASASYIASNDFWSWAEISALTFAGVALQARSFSVKGNQNLKADRNGLGNTKREPIPNGMGMVEASIDIEWDGLTDYASFLAGTQGALVITFTSAAFITGSTPYVFTISIPAANLMDYSPSKDAPEVPTLTMSLRGEYNGTNPIVTLVVDNADTAA